MLICRQLLDVLNAVLFFRSFPFVHFLLILCFLLAFLVIGGRDAIGKNNEARRDQGGSRLFDRVVLLGSGEGSVGDNQYIKTSPTRSVERGVNAGGELIHQREDMSPLETTARTAITQMGDSLAHRKKAVAPPQQSSVSTQSTTTTATRKSSAKPALTDELKSCDTGLEGDAMEAHDEGVSECVRGGDDSSGMAPAVVVEDEERKDGSVELRVRLGGISRSFLLMYGFPAADM